MQANFMTYKFTNRLFFPLIYAFETLDISGSQEGKIGVLS